MLECERKSIINNRDEKRFAIEDEDVICSKHNNQKKETNTRVKSVKRHPLIKEVFH